MNTKLVMTVCAIVLGILGILLSFLPQEAAVYLEWANTQSLALQLLGAMYFGFAMMNWTAKSSLIGGIYGRPIAVGNFSHFLIGALVLVNWLLKNPPGIPVVIVTLIYVIFTLLFGYILFVHPGLKTK